jgi:hypothetical protein
MSPPPLTHALFTTVPVTELTTVKFNELLPPAAIPVVVVQLTNTLPPAIVLLLQLHPEPEPDTKLKPVAKVSLTTVVPNVLVVPLLLTVKV